jgi:hypothetical protein
MNFWFVKSRYSQDRWVEGELCFGFSEKEVKTHAWCMFVQVGFSEKDLWIEFVGFR